MTRIGRELHFVTSVIIQSTLPSENNGYDLNVLDHGLWFEFTKDGQGGTHTSFYVIHYHDGIVVNHVKITRRGI